MTACPDDTSIHRLGEDDVARQVHLVLELKLHEVKDAGSAHYSDVIVVVLLQYMHKNDALVVM